MGMKKLLSRIEGKTKTFRDRNVDDIVRDLGGLNDEVDLKVSEAPINGQEYLRKDGAWIAGGGGDLNQWLMRGVAFVSSSTGDDGTAVIGDGNLPFKTILAAQNASNKVIILMGIYDFVSQGTNSLRILDGKHLHFMLGAELGQNTRLQDSGLSINSVITGQLVCGLNSYGFSFTGATTKMSIEMEAMENTKQICRTDNGADIHLIIKRILCNNSTGSGVACRVYDDGSITIDVLEYCYSYHWLAASGSGVGTGHFTINCPDLRILANNTYGNQFKALINDQSNGHAIFTVNVDKFRHEATAQTTAFGVVEGAMGLYAAGGSGNYPNEYHFTGDYDTGKMYGWFDYYGIRQGLTTFKNGSIKCETVPFSSIAVAVGVPVIRTIVAENFHFEGGLTADGFNQIGNGRIASFINCSFKNTNVAGSRIFNHNNATPVAGAPFLYLYNCIGDMDNAGAGALIGGAVLPFNFASVNTYSSEPIGALIVDSWLGYTQIVGFKIPKF